MSTIETGEKISAYLFPHLNPFGMGLFRYDCSAFALPFSWDNYGGNFILRIRPFLKEITIHCFPKLSGRFIALSG